MYKDKCGTSYENSTRTIFEGAGEYDIPIIKPTKITENKFIGFNEILSSSLTITSFRGCGIHPTGTLKSYKILIVCCRLISVFTLIIRQRCRFITTIASIG